MQFGSSIILAQQLQEKGHSLSTDTKIYEFPQHLRIWVSCPLPPDINDQPSDPGCLQIHYAPDSALQEQSLALPGPQWTLHSR